MSSAKGKLNTKFTCTLGNTQGVQQTNYQFDTIQNQVNDIYQETSRKLADYDNTINQFKRQIDNRPDMSEINDLLNTKANKPTVAQALHRKANKGEIDEQLARKVDIDEFNRLVSKVNEKVNNTQLNQIFSQLENKADRNEVNDIQNERVFRSTDSVESTMFNALAKDRDIYNTRLENFEIEFRSNIDNIEREIKNIIDSFNSGLSKKADYRDLDSINSSVLNKADVEMVTDLLSELKSQILDKIKSNKTELEQKSKDLSEDIYERYNKMSQKVDKCIKDVKVIRETTKEMNSETSQIRSDVKDIILKEVDNINSGVKEEITQAMDDWQTSRIKIENEVSQRVKKTDLVDFKEEMTSRLEPKVELSEVQAALNSLQTEIANRLVSTKGELQNSINSTNEYLNHQISKKCDSEEFHSEMATKIDSHQLRQILDAKANKADFEVLRDTQDRMIKEIDNKAPAKELEGHIEFTRSSIEDITREIIQRAKSRDINNLIDEKAGREELDRMYQNMQRELNDKVSSKEIKSTLDEQALINEAL